MRRSLWATAAIVAVLAVPASAQATPPPTMSGELFLSFFEPSGPTPRKVETTCNRDGTSTLHFTVLGSASGPYNGTFTEDATITIGPQVLPPIPSGGPFDPFSYGFNAGPVATYDATFSIAPFSGDTSYDGVTGTKHLVSPVPADSLGFCFEVNNQPVPGLPGIDQRTGYSVGARAAVTYAATIQTSGGSFHDQGTGGAAVREGYITGDPPTRVGGFGERFTSSQPGTTEDQPAFVTLSPPDAVNDVSTSHTVTATVRGGTGDPLGNVVVRFTVAGSVNTSLQCTTGANGQCSVTYAGPDLPGADVISAYADANGNGTQDIAEPFGTPATKAWVLPASTPGQVTGGGQILNATSTDRIAFGFNAQNQNTGLKGNCSVVDPFSSVHVKCLDVTSLVQSGTHATFFGNADADGTATTYRIDVDDNGEPGTTDTFKIHTSSGYTASGTLERGNVQIH
jgi:hypothetical protein